MPRDLAGDPHPVSLAPGRASSSMSKASIIHEFEEAAARYKS
jgi:hypothetical protein